ncbi:MAG: hypothetical protein QOK10_3623 [Pseudonocardiales bacterium]|jgi:signal transduction histidine kinase/CHASE3 domain sensor protein/uncharacterized protein YoaH (UPF0181 family)|nr:hypothetical protein [Pseudonocardiales bacterium]
MIAASALLALIIGGAFALLLFAIGDLRGAERHTRHAQDVLVSANELERLLLDLETGQRGFLLTRQEAFLEPWKTAQTAFPREASALLAMVVGEGAVETEARAIEVQERSYINDYSLPLVNAARRGDPSAASVASTEAGKRRVDAMRANFDRLIGAERRIDARSRASAETDAGRASTAAAIALAGSIALIALYAGYLTRAIVRPVRRAAVMAGRLAGGDLSARMPETGVAEIVELERAFNVMGRSLERGRVELAGLAAEQASLRRVATLVAQGASPAEAFSAVAQELARLLEADITMVLRFEEEMAATVVGGWSDGSLVVPIGVTMTLEGEGVATKIRQTGEPARIERFAGPPGSLPGWYQGLGARIGVGSPIIVEGVLWGVTVAVFTRAGPLAENSEARIDGFTELVATAIANAQAREELRRVADEQAALRQVATLVARAAQPAAVFAAVAEEVGRLLPADSAFVVRYDADDTATIVGGWSASSDSVPLGTPFTLGPGDLTLLVRDSGQAARIDDYAAPPGSLAAALDIHSLVAAPITVEGRLWGLIGVASTQAEPPPPGTEQRLAGFTELVATAIANADARAELTSSRARVVATADQTRRRIERDLHDGAQQRLVSLALQLRATQASVRPEQGELRADLSHIATGLTNALDELRELARGIHPASLAEGGLGPALKTLARRSAVPVSLDLRRSTRLPEPIEVAAYYVVSEALTNAAKHSQASAVWVEVQARDAVLHISVRDDGRGGADFARGTGLVGLKDRVEALGGRMSIESAAGAGTWMRVELPVIEDGRSVG